MKYLLIVLLILISSCGFYNPRYSYDEIQYLDEIAREIIQNPDMAFDKINSNFIGYNDEREIAHFDIDSVEKYFTNQNYELCKNALRKIKAPLHWNSIRYNLSGYLLYNVKGTNHYLQFNFSQLDSFTSISLWDIKYKYQDKCKEIKSYWLNQTPYHYNEEFIR
jgi:hypothetical protein